MSERRTVTIIHTGDEAEFRIALGIILRQLLRGSLAGKDAGRWEYRVETVQPDKRNPADQGGAGS
jgi:hypothetical protein